MTNPALHQRIQGASLWAVPSVHFRIAFAEEVNRLCSREKPDAVAVELGPQAATAASAWLRELGVGSGPSRFTLPCMLGLTRPNRRIRASRRETAVRLQEITGKELSELPPEILQHFLDYSAISVLYLSPTDSIIEAVRCALELKVPLYGVDLEETAEAKRKECKLQDPALAAREMERYVQRNGGFAEHQRDEEIDGRRELAMAARLKFLLGKHARILFVCGLAHWRQIQKLLQAADPQPSPVAPSTEQAPVHFQRVIVHPLLAIHHLDTFPAFASAYENDRPNVTRPPKLRTPLNVRQMFLEMLRSTYEKHFLYEETGEQLDRVVEDWDAQDDFERLLQNLCLLHQRQAPDLFTALAAAQGIMSKRFCRTFGETLMDFDWARPDEFADLQILAPAPSIIGRPLRAELIDREGRRSRWFHVHSLPERSGISVRVPIPWEWNIEPPPPPPGERDGGNSNWAPIDTLMTALSFRAVRVAREQSSTPKSELFEGSLLEGVDMKATLRSANRGEDRIFVRAGRRQPRVISRANDDVEGFPFVWILRLMDNAKVTWKFSYDTLSELRTYLGDPTRWDAAGLASRGYVISSVIAVTNSRTDEELSFPQFHVRRDDRIGQLSYHPDCSKRAAAVWAETSRLKRDPTCTDVSFACLSELYRERFGMGLGGFPWHVTLVRLAIPFAQNAITVVAPDHYSLPPTVHLEAARHRVEIRQVPLSYFPTEALRKISRISWIPTLGRTKDELDLPKYPEHVYRHFKEPVDIYHRLIPKVWR